jgi:hypothetical protein
VCEARFAKCQGKTSTKTLATKEPAMFFTPKKRGRDWYWFHMMILYGFAFVSGAAAIGVLLSSDDDLAGGIIGALMFSVATLITWKLGRHCSKMVAQMGNPR